MISANIADSVACCGLVCALCDPGKPCDCHSENCCGKRLADIGCIQYDCCTRKGLRGCWECDDSPCGQDMLAPSHVKTRAFIACIREDGMDRFAQYIERNRARGIVYHRSGFHGDYDLADEAAVLRLLREGPDVAATGEAHR